MLHKEIVLQQNSHIISINVVLHHLKSLKSFCFLNNAHFCLNIFEVNICF